MVDVADPDRAPLSRALRDACPPGLLDRLYGPGGDGCTCRHVRADHRRGESRCRELDSYGCPCECPSFEPDPKDSDDG